MWKISISFVSLSISWLNRQRRSGRSTEFQYRGRNVSILVSQSPTSLTLALATLMTSNDSQNILPVETILSSLITTPVRPNLPLLTRLRIRLS